jgi:hypothetical protein
MVVLATSRPNYYIPTNRRAAKDFVYKQKKAPKFSGLSLWVGFYDNNLLELSILGK